jgi:16S rRNA (cytidine1402-2'-O)-methyltransferase
VPNLFLIPSLLGDTLPNVVLPQGAAERIGHLRHFVAERAKTARHFLKQLAFPLPELQMSELNAQNLSSANWTELLRPALVEGFDMGLLSEAGCPAVADPGSELVRVAHERGLTVVPLVGASSILLTLMASGLGGQCFAFWGYLPVATQERRTRLQWLEQQATRNRQTQLFIETPYRNEQLFADMLQHLQADTQISLGIDLTTPTEQTRTCSVRQWRKIVQEQQAPSLHKRPVVFALR